MTGLRESEKKKIKNEKQRTRKAIQNGGKRF